MTFSSYVEQELSKLESKGEDYILTLISEYAEENLQLEFKTKKETSERRLHRDDKQNLGKSISGFSNAEGGLAIWGIATQKNENGIDKATDRRPISYIDTSLEIFRSQCATSVQPENPNVKIVAVRCKDDLSKGYIVVAVPKGSSRPYMSKAPDHNKYFRRTTLGFQPLEHYEVVDMIRAEANASFDLRWGVRHQGTHRHGHSFYLDIYFYNNGQVQAEEPYVFFSDWPRIAKLVPVDGYRLRLDPPEFGTRAVFTCPSLEMLVPQGYLHFVQIDFHLTEPAENSLPRWGALPNRHADNVGLALGNFHIGAMVGARNGAASKIELSFSDQEIQTKCLKILRR